MRVNITLEHKESGERLYLTSKNKRNTPDRLQLKKYSPKGKIIELKTMKIRFSWFFYYSKRISYDKNRNI